MMGMSLCELTSFEKQLSPRHPATAARYWSGAGVVEGFSSEKKIKAMKVIGLYYALGDFIADFHDGYVKNITAVKVSGPKGPAQIASTDKVEQGIALKSLVVDNKVFPNKTIVWEVLPETVIERPEFISDFIPLSHNGDDRGIKEKSDEENHLIFGDPY